MRLLHLLISREASPQGRDTEVGAGARGAAVSYLEAFVQHGRTGLVASGEQDCCLGIHQHKDQTWPYQLGRLLASPDRLRGSKAGLT